MLEDRGLGEFRLVGLRRVTVLRRQRANIDERLDAIIRARSGDDGAPIGVSDQYDWTARAAQRRPHRSGVVGDGVQMVLRRDHFIAVGDQQLDDLAETGSVGPQAMCEDNAGFAGHTAPPRTVRWHLSQREGNYSMVSPKS